MSNRPINVLGRSQNTHVEQLNAYQVDGDYHVHTAQDKSKRFCPHSLIKSAIWANHSAGLYELLQPIEDTSHTRDRKRSPPDSACTRGTRVEVVKKVTTWTADNISAADEPHILWMHGYVGSGKSAISQEVCVTSGRQDRPVASFFFFRNAGDRSKIWRLATTLASQMAAVVPETEHFVRVAVKANPALLRQDEAGVSLQSRMQSLVYAPFKAAVQGGRMIVALARGPFLIVLDGLDECDNKDEVQELIEGMLAFFDDNPFIPLRVFITSRVEQHIQSHLDVPGVRLDNLVDHCSDADIATFLEVLFKNEMRRNPVIRAYISEHGEWPPTNDKRKLVQHIGGSFIFASTVFKFIMGSTAEDGSSATPMDRLPLALKMNPGLDGLYTQTLARSQHLPHFPDIISTIALLETPLPTSGIAELLGISTYKVVNVLVNLQAIIQVPGTDDIPVTLFHTSLRDFLTTQSRSGRFFAHPREHVRLYFRCLQCELVYRQHGVRSLTNNTQRKPAAAYACRYSAVHLSEGGDLFQSAEFDLAIKLCRETLGLYPGTPELIQSLARVTVDRAWRTGSLVDFEEAISLNRQLLEFRPSSHPDRSASLSDLGIALWNRYQQTRAMADLEEATSLRREALELEPSPHPHRSSLLSDLGSALCDRYRCTGSVADLDEAISVHREALELRPSPHPNRSVALNTLGDGLRDRYQHTGIVPDLEEAISLYREALEISPPPHPDRSWSLNNLGRALCDRSRCTRTTADLEEAISLHREALELSPPPHPNYPSSLNNLGLAFRDRYECTGTVADLEEAISLYREALEFSSLPHPNRLLPLKNLGLALCDRYRRTRTTADLEEAISLHRQVLELRPSPHPQRSLSLSDLGVALGDRYQLTGTVADIEEAISLYREALELLPPPHPNRSSSLNDLGNALLSYHRLTGAMADLEEAISLYREALELQPSPHPNRSLPLYKLALSLKSMYEATHKLSHLQEAIAHCEELLEFCHAVRHQDRADWLLTLGSLLQMRFDTTGHEEDLAKILTLKEEANRLSTSSTESTT
ncbi:hypothetical protein EST38_g8606 [Candolleomyces aberdarensis]|uniref:Nephrocystin 3-like N-terminal domain-containing protein n=1 Tax=Candolleomyces aberdarensis TaxID=2316362 RepID=A0A4Q2DCU8_9AGAR|nr:hypothetical protein EST38_g8606 [Candolleomyces aberdarensis]